MEELQKLHIQGAIIRVLRPEDFDAILPSKKTALKDLALLNRNIAPDTPAQILIFSEGLTHFTMKGEWRAKSLLEAGFDPMEYIEGIERSSSAGLEYLDLDIWDATVDEPLDFSRLECLKHLTMPNENSHFG
ncbi:hypothetical protein N7491_008040 [Penicillium cf. griseofulvum]|uniref:Uncharacterized protein n=1 Tax=Penicillium cf. griseofulvum TaxID=2972120 RepID=A0A9W9J529_9EURO|nr:hypothetical protein N7472_008933 [Penicillium cf. griseofulvum]KAJ5427598.1 hypothetical protein N7491_008040 [Penicillium cf. griseofulvum]